jgi:hypothetical protein
VTPHNEEVAISLLFFQNVESTFMGFVRNFTCMIVVSNILKDTCGFLFFSNKLIYESYVQIQRCDSF